MSAEKMLELAREIKSLDDQIECPEGPRTTRQYMALLKQVRRRAVALADIVA
ncbi:hypothetical protein ACMTN4_07270 [Rhodococcus globerulus]|uniref:hypothetical protein n=1 Tax=Rhodococcus globerulus TaxID=33008 RepID=UPI0039E98DD5